MWVLSHHSSPNGSHKGGWTTCIVQTNMLIAWIHAHVCICRWIVSSQHWSACFIFFKHLSLERINLEVIFGCPRVCLYSWQNRVPESQTMEGILKQLLFMVVFPWCITPFCRFHLADWTQRVSPHFAMSVSASGRGLRDPDIPYPFSASHWFGAQGLGALKVPIWKTNGLPELLNPG